MALKVQKRFPGNIADFFVFEGFEEGHAYLEDFSPLKIDCSFLCASSSACLSGVPLDLQEGDDVLLFGEVVQACYLLAR